MSDKFFPDISVGDFAADILKSMAKDPNGLRPALKESTVQAANAPDISRISVSNDFVSLVVEGKKPKKAEKIVETKETAEVKLDKLLTNLSTLIVEAKQLVEELSSGMTSVGNLGTTGLASKPIKPRNKNKDNLKMALSSLLGKTRR
jgi:hypothetical protein